MTARQAERALDRALKAGGPRWVNVAGRAALVLSARPPRRPTLVLPPAPCLPFRWWKLARRRAAVALPFLCAARLHAQVQPVVWLDRHGAATSLVRNPSPGAQTVTVELRGPLPALDGVRALVAPAAFLLAPGETQVVRLKVRDAVAPGTVLRLRTCLTPVAPRVAAPETAVRAVVTVRTCILAKVVAP
jgi:hypothetical protein